MTPPDGDGGSAFVSRISQAVPDPAERDLLEDIRLTKRLRLAVCTPLQAMGFRIDDETRCDPFGTSCKSVEVAERDGFKLVLLNVPRGILKTTSGPNVQAVNYLEQILQSGDWLVIFSEGLKGLPEPPYRQMWDTWSTQGKATVGFVPWSDVESLAKHADGERAVALEQILRLALRAPLEAVEAVEAVAPVAEPAATLNGEPPPRRPPDLNLSGSERDLLVDVLAEQAASGNLGDPQDYFNDLVMQTDVPDSWARKVKGQWTGNTPMDARRLVGWAIVRNSFPPGHERAGDTVLGALVEPIVKDTYSDEMHRLGQMVVKRRLLRPAALAGLREWLSLEQEEDG